MRRPEPPAGAAGGAARHVYGVPYMTTAASESLRLTLRGFSPRELVARAERECKQHFGACAWRIDEATCSPCMGSLGGHVRLYEARIVASTVAGSD